MVIVVGAGVEWWQWWRKKRGVVLDDFSTCPSIRCESVSRPAACGDANHIALSWRSVNLEASSFFSQKQLLRQ